MFLPATHVAQAIPTLSERQFIVAKETPAGVDQMVQRELFWYREELFRCITARWKEVSLYLGRRLELSNALQPGGTRHGHLSLRNQRLTSPMMETLKTDPIRVKLDLIPQAEDRADEKPIPAINGRIYARPTQFHTLRCHTYNATGMFSSPYYRCPTNLPRKPNQKYWSFH